MRRSVLQGTSPSGDSPFGDPPSKRRKISSVQRCAVARKQRRRNRVVSAATSRNYKRRKKPPPPSDGHSRVELDSHAEGAVFGRDCRVINDTGTRVSVDGFDPVSMQVNGIPIVTVAVAYDCPIDRPHLHFVLSSSTPCPQQ